MKKIQSVFIVFLFILFCFPNEVLSQDSQLFELRYEINPIFPPLSVSKEILTKAETISDLNSHYQSSWINEYLSVEISASQKGVVTKAISTNDRLSEEQKDLMEQADIGTNITVNVQYLPENNLINNEPKTINFSFLVNPEITATYPEGQAALQQFLKQRIIDDISTTVFKEHHLTAVKFTVDEAGQPSKVHLFESSKDEEIDALLVETISEMPRWNPAAYANGTKVSQEFVLTIGDHKSCIVNLLNIHRASIK